MSDNGRPRFKTLRPWGLAGLLALIVILKLLSGRQDKPLPVLAESSPRATARPVMAAITATSATPTKAHSIDSDATVDVCGFGQVAVDADDPSAAGRYVDHVTSATRDRWLHALLDSGDIRARSAGLFLKDKLVGNGAGLLIEEQTRDALVQLAVGASDPVIYAMAVYACNSDSDSNPSGSCQQITLNGWASLDSDNAVPWLLLAGSAQRKKDSAAEAAAFSHAAKAGKTDAYNFSLYAYSELEMPSDATPLERWSLALEVIGIEAATASLQYHVAGNHCSAAAMSDDGARQKCGTLAELLVDKGTNLLDLSAGIRMGANAGWSPQRVAALTEERDSLMQAIWQAAPSSKGDMWTCDGARRGNAYMSRWARLGEMGAAREAVEQSGQSVAELALAQRDFMHQLQPDAAK